MFPAEFGHRVERVVGHDGSEVAFLFRMVLRPNLQRSRRRKRSKLPVVQLFERVERKNTTETPKINPPSRDEVKNNAVRFTYLSHFFPRFSSKEFELDKVCESLKADGKRKNTSWLFLIQSVERTKHPQNRYYHFSPN